jgi:hypothetical protein
VVDGFRDELVGLYQLDISGQITSFFRPPPPVTLDTRIAPRPGITYRKHSEGEAVRMNFGARTITFPDFFGEALDFALRTPSFATRDLPGDIEDQERVVFVERLLQEGIVVRK